jgi:hypothetical protein
MANPFDIQDFIPGKRWITSNPYQNLALANDTAGVDRDSIENDLWVNIVDVVILVSLAQCLGLPDVPLFSHVCMVNSQGFTIIGAGSILTSMLSRELRGKGATVRTRLVQGLVCSDLTLG